MSLRMSCSRYDTLILSLKQQARGVIDRGSVRIAGVWGVEPPLPHPADPLPLVKIRPRGVEFQPPHLSFVEVGMLLDSHFLLMQFLKYLQCDDLNVFLLF